MLKFKKFISVLLLVTVTMVYCGCDNTAVSVSETLPESSTVSVAETTITTTAETTAETTVETTTKAQTTTTPKEPEYIDEDGYLFKQEFNEIDITLIYPEDDENAEEFNKLIYDTMHPIFTEIRDIWPDHSTSLYSYYNPYAIENERYVQIIYRHLIGFKDNWNAGNIKTFCYDKIERKIVTLEDAISNDKDLPSGISSENLTDKAMQQKRHQLDGYKYDSGEVLGFIYTPDGNGGFITQYFMKTRFQTDLSTDLSEYLYAYTPKMERIDLVYYESPLNNQYRPEKIRNRTDTKFIDYRKFDTYSAWDTFSLILNANGGDNFDGIEEGAIIFDFGYDDGPEQVTITKNGVDYTYTTEPIVIGGLSVYSYYLYDDSGEKQYEIYFNDLAPFSVEYLSLYDADGNPIGEWVKEFEW